jgi:hypothetical protein
LPWPALKLHLSCHYIVLTVFGAAEENQKAAYNTEGRFRPATSSIVSERGTREGHRSPNFFALVRVNISPSAYAKWSGTKRGRRPAVLSVTLTGLWPVLVEYLFDGSKSSRLLLRPLA